MEEKIYYLDNATTAFLSADVYKKMLETYASCQAAAESQYSLGRESQRELDAARAKVAKAIGAEADEIYFTSGATEANNWAIKGIAKANKQKGNHIIVSAIEHLSVLDACRELETEGFKVTYVPVDENGVVDYASIIKAIGPDTILISIMFANNDVGSFQPIRAIAELAKQNEVAFHTDAAVAVGAIEINVKELGLDALSISSHKLGGPKGVGALYVKRGTKIAKLIDGGEQEADKRAGAQNVPAIAGFGVAIENATTDLEEKVKAVRVLRKYFQKKLSETVHNISLNGHPIARLAGNCSISFEGADAESVVMMLDREGVCASATYITDGKQNQKAHTLVAMGKDAETIHSTVRFSLSSALSREDIDAAVEKIRKAVKRVRSMSAVRIYKNKVEL